MMVFSSLFIITYFLLLLFAELPFHVVFLDLNLPKAGPQDVRFLIVFLPVVLILCKLSFGLLRLKLK